MNRITEVVKNLIIINVIVFLGVSITEQYSGMSIIRYFQLYSPMSENFIPVQMVTHMFMHGSLSHLFFNLLSLFFLGPYIEKKMGPKRFLMFYFACGFGAMLAHLGIDYIEFWKLGELTSGITSEQLKSLMSQGTYQGTGLNEGQARQIYEGLYGAFNIPVVGASGAIYGVFVAFALFFPNMKLMLLIPPIPVKAKFLVVAIIAFDLFSGVSGQKTGIAHFAHLGGALTGVILVYAWYSHIFKK